MEPFREVWTAELGSSVTAVACSPTSDLVAAGTAGGGVHLFDGSGTEVASIEMEGMAGSAAFIPTKEHVVIGMGVVTDGEPTPGKLMVFDRTGQVVWARDLPRYVRAVAFVPGAGIVAASGSKLFALGLDGRPKWKATFHGTVMAIAAARPSGEGARPIIAASGYDKTLHILDVKGKVLWEQSLWRFVNSLSFTADGAGLLAGLYENRALMYKLDKDEAVTIWDVEAKASVPFIRAHADGKRALFVSADKHIVCVDLEGKVLLNHPVPESVAGFDITPSWGIAYGDIGGTLTFLAEPKREVITVGKGKGKGRGRSGSGKPPGRSAPTGSNPPLTPPPAGRQGGPRDRKGPRIVE